MRSLCKAWGIGLLLATYAAGQPVGPASGGAVSGATGSNGVAPSHAEVRAAVEKLRLDPNIGRDRTIKSLRWVDSTTSAPAPTAAPNWIIGLFQFMSQATSLLFWAAGAIGLAVAAVWVYRVVQSRRPARARAVSGAASHIQDLDIRPASLPADVGGAALALLAAGSTREALALLYRGALSRAVHNFSVAIGESFTEGEALRAVRQHLDEPRARYFSALIGLWQRAVYAADAPPAQDVAALCREFSPVLGGTPI